MVLFRQCLVPGTVGGMASAPQTTFPGRPETAPLPGHKTKIVVEAPDDWTGFARAWLGGHHLSGGRGILVAGPSAHHRIEFMRLDAARQ